MKIDYEFFEKYDNHEKKIIKELHPKIYSDFIPRTLFNHNVVEFNYLGDDYKSSTSKGNIDAINGLHPNQFEKNLDLISYLTPDEISLFLKIYNKLNNFNIKNNILDTINFKNDISGAILPFRSIKKLIDPNEGKVLDFGSGLGFVTTMLSENGYKCYSYEVNRNFFFAQSMILNHIFNDDHYEILFDYKKFENCNKNITLIPWFIFCNYKYIKFSNLKLITINHAINELSVRTFKFLMEIINKNINSKNVNEFFLVIENFGSNTTNNFNRLIYDYNFKKIHEPCENYEQIYVLKKKLLFSNYYNNKSVAKPNKKIFKKKNLFFLKFKIFIILLIKKIFFFINFRKRIKVLKKPQNLNNDTSLKEFKKKLYSDFKQENIKTELEEYEKFSGF